MSGVNEEAAGLGLGLAERIGSVLAVDFWCRPEFFVIKNFDFEAKF